MSNAVPNHSRGAAVNIVPELMIRQILKEGIVSLAADEPRLDEMFGRVDDLYAGSQDQWTDDMKAGVRRIVSTPDMLRVGVGYPTTIAVLPYYSIVIESGGEQSDEATTGDVASVTYQQTGVPSATDPTASQSIEHKTLATGWSTTVQVGTWSRAPEESVLLHSVSREVLFRDKGRLLEAGVHDVTFTESGFAPDQSPLYPDCGYVPMLRVVMRWTLRTTKRAVVPTRMTMSGGSYG